MKKTLINIEFAIRIIVILAFLLEEGSILAQTQNVKFSKISDINGVTLGKINAMTYDSYGFLWLSDQTNRAVIRYDGSQIKRYTDNPADAVSLGGFYPECLYADTAGVMWIGYYGQGLDRLDPKTNTVTHYDHNPNDPNSLSDNFVTSIVMDSEGKIWVGNYGGVDVLDPVSGEFKNYVNNPDDENSLSYNKVRKIYKDKAGTIWIGTGFPWDENDLGGLNRYNREQDDFTRYLHDTQDPSSLIDNRVRSIFEDSRGNFWIGTGGDGLHTMDRRAGTFTRHQYNPDRPETLSRSPVYNNFDHVTTITEDSENQIWIGTQSGGIARYNPSTSTIQYFGEDMDASLGFDDNSGWWIQPGDDGLVWIATEQANLFKVELYNYTIPKLDLGTEVFNLLEDSHSKLWIGTENGLLVADGINGKPKQYTNLPVELEDMGHFFHELIEDNSGNIWIGMHNGLYRFNPNTNTGQAFRHDPNDPKSISGNDISIIYEDSDSLLWIGTVNSGLNRYDPKKKVFIRYQYQPADLSTLSSNNVRTIIQEDSEHMLIGLFDNAGLNRVNRQTGEITRFLPGLSIRDLYKDSFGEIWIGTHNGLYLQDSITNDFVALIDHNPVINIPSAIKSIVEDDQYHLWFGTIKGLYRLNAERTHLILYDEGNGVSGVTPGHLGQNCRLSDGTIIFRAGSENYVIDPMSLNSATYDIDLYFTELIIAGQEILSNDHRALQLPIIDSDDVHLKYNENSFALGVSALNFRDIGDQRVLYKMDDYDPDWRELDSGEKISYYRVPSGRYQLEVKTSNMDTGQWFNKKLNIIIANPWWAQWWAYLLYGLIILGAGRWFYHLQKARLVREEKERHRLQELEHAREIEKAYSELEVTHNNLKSTQTQLIQSEKMASLGELTAGIAHEIQNPLNFVNNFSEVNKELLLELKEEIRNGNIQEVKNLADNAIDNEDKIIHHGKRAGAIVKSMLQHSRSRQGEREEVDLNELADEYLRLAYHGMRAKDKSFNADMETDFDKNLGKLKLVPQDIGRVILNLITNAFYAVHQKKQKSNGMFKPVVTIKTKQENGKVELEVADNGIGMSEEIARKVFQPFFTTKPTGQGTGLGLSLSYDIIKAHGGELKVDSEKGKGTQFIVTLPIVT